MPAFVGVTPDVNSEVITPIGASDLQSGGKRRNVFLPSDTLDLSVGEKRYPFDRSKTWFVLRSYHSKILDLKRELDREILFIPTLHVVEKVNGKRVTIEKPLITNLLFLYTTQRAVKEYIDGISLFYQYNHCAKNEFGRSTPMQVGYREMINFVNATSTDEEDVRIVDETKVIHYKSGDMVEVTAGPFKGVRGRVARLAGQQRVIVELRDVCKFATTYIPNCWLRQCQFDS